MLYVGVDFHKKYSPFTEMDEGGTISRQFRLSNERESLIQYVDYLPSESGVAIEATYNWYYFYDLLEEQDIDVSLAHPAKTKAIASARIMNDKISSTILADLLRTNYLPTAYIPPRQVRDTREMLRSRAFLVAMRTRLKNRVHAILSKNGLECPYTDIFGKKSLRWLKGLELRPCYRQPLDSYIRLAECFGKEIELITQTIHSLALESPEARLLDTHPGISYYSALLIATEIGTIDRFPTHGQLCSYAGLVPSVHSSGGKTRLGSITKQGSKWLRWILIECSSHAVKGSARYKCLYKRVAYKHGKAVARVAVARSMLRVMYYMLKYNRPFQEHPILERSPVSALGS